MRGLFGKLGRAGVFGSVADARHRQKLQDFLEKEGFLFYGNPFYICTYLNSQTYEHNQAKSKN